MDITKILKEMTLEEKARLLSGRKLWFFNGVPRLGIRDFIVSDGPHGIRAYDDFNENDGYPSDKRPATAFPSASCMASTWNEELLFQVGETIAKECNHYKVDIVLGPGVNGKRSPLGGRNFEYYSEDPVLTAKMGIGFVKGVQSLGVGTSLKHFILNEQENLRRYISSEIDERTFRELYALPFEMIVKEAKPLTIMASYNRIEGVYSCENEQVLTKLLRDEWNYEGLTISDWGGVQHKRASVLAGLDIEMPESEFTEPFIESVLKGEYPIEAIDRSATRILKAYEWMLANPNHGKPTSFEENHKIAQKVAEEGIVLLKNEQNFLPLKEHEKVVVLGLYAEKPRTHGGGSSELLAFKTEIPLTEIEQFADVEFFPDYALNDASIKAIRKAKSILLFTGTTTELEHEGDDRIHMRLPSEQVRFILEVAQLNNRIVIINNSGSAIEVKDFINHIQAFMQCWFLGSASGSAIAKILFGVVNPSGRLSETFPYQIENTPTFPYYPGEGDKTDYTEGLFTGYRYYDTHRISTSFPFGFGLSYTTFKHTNLVLSSSKMTHGEKLKVMVDVKNTGRVKGKEVLQLYVRNLTSGYANPDKILKGFVKKSIDPDEIKTYVWLLSDHDFMTFIPDCHQFMVEKGKYEILIGTSAENIFGSATIEFDSKDVTIPRLSIKAPLRQWVSNLRHQATIKAFLAEQRTVHFYEYEEPLERVVTRLLQEIQQSEIEISAMLKALQNAVK